MKCIVINKIYKPSLVGVRTCIMPVSYKEVFESIRQYTLCKFSGEENEAFCQITLWHNGEEYREEIEIYPLSDEDPIRVVNFQ